MPSSARAGSRSQEPPGEIVNAIEFQGTSRPLERLRQILGDDDVPATDRELSELVAVARDW
jgi:hypothetical protein